MGITLGNISQPNTSEFKTQTQRGPVGALQTPMTKWFTYCAAGSPEADLLNHVKGAIEHTDSAIATAKKLYPDSRHVQRLADARNGLLASAVYIGEALKTKK